MTTGGGAPTVTKADLQSDITDRLHKAGQKPQSVTCSADLEGVVGKTTTCEVVLSPINAFEPIVTVTKVEGTTVSYEMSPALSKAQLEKSVKDIVARHGGKAVESVTCGSALEGTVGNKASCEVVAGGRTMTDTVTVTKVDGLLMNFSVTAG
ncbi:DUF4333 domain-containing protein [Mycolicibacterium komossense]|uniref:DUF4333 domain-containing protein n=1 Tax=Mycolicibacterium komossense TaxID=1779 RepID=A0ABT3C837_9MYCO|nr:DUF4333 domain-containing protein [Mycolicibacterium komossense]